MLDSDLAASSCGARRSDPGFPCPTDRFVGRIQWTVTRAVMAGLHMLLLAVTPLLSESAPKTSAGEVSSVLQKCQVCHRGVGAMAGLDLTTRGGALLGGSSGPALEPGASAKSLLYEKVRSGEMPPGGPLSKAEVDSVRHWIDQGAAWPAGDPDASQAGAASPEPLWWSLKPVHRPAIPSVKRGAWVGRPIDAFILAALEERGLEPSPPAAREVLIRRATLDLLGLPPRPGRSRRSSQTPRPEPTRIW